MTAGTSTAAIRQFEYRDAATGGQRAQPVRRMLLPVLVATAILSQVFAGAGNTTVSWVTALTFATFILVINGPAWAIVPILINELTLYGFPNPMFGVAQRFVVAGIAVMVVLPVISRTRFFSDLRMRRVLLPAMAFVLIVTVMNFQHSREAYVYEYLRYQLVQVATLVIAACVLRRISDIRQISILVVITTFVVSMIVITQHYAPSFALYGFRDTLVKGRAVGLTNGPVPIANQLIFVLGPLLGVLLAQPVRFKPKYLLLAGSAFVTLVGLNFTYTRSALFSLAPALVVMGLFFGGRRRMLILGAVIAGIVMFVGLENTGVFGSRYYESAEDDRSAASHEALQRVSLAIALDHPITGIGHEAFTDVSLDYVDDVDATVADQGGTSALGQQQPHNDFWNVWLSWGIFALAAFIAIYIGTFRNLALATKHHDRFIRGLAIGCLGGLVMYGVNSIYHNSLDSSVFLWFYAGLSVSLARLAREAAAPSTQPVAIVPAQRRA